MVSNKALAKALRKSATKIAKIRDQQVREAAEYMVENAITIGGSMSGYQLGAEVKKVSNRGDTSTATVEAFPSGFWSIKTFGRRGGYMIPSSGAMRYGRAMPINGGLYRRATGGAASGDGRWDTVIDNVDERFPDLMDDAIEAVIV